jgi:hypothetical protein
MNILLSIIAFIGLFIVAGLAASAVPGAILAIITLCVRGTQMAVDRLEMPCWLSGAFSSLIMVFFIPNCLMLIWPILGFKSVDDIGFYSIFARPLYALYNVPIQLISDKMGANFVIAPDVVWTLIVYSILAVIFSVVCIVRRRARSNLV